MILSPTVRTRFKAALWRMRYTLLAIAALAALLTLAHALAPPPEGVPALILAREVRAGSVLTGDDVASVRLPAPVAAATVGKVSDAVGKRLMLDLPKGSPLGANMLSGSSLLERAPPATAIIPVAVADEGSLSLAEVGSTVTLLGVNARGEGAVLAYRVQVMAKIEKAARTTILDTGRETVTLLVAVPLARASVVVEASAIAPLRVAQFPPEKGNGHD